MEYIGTSGEYFQLLNLKNTADQSVFKNNSDSFSVFWSENTTNCLVIDSVKYVLKPNQIVFLTEMHKVEITEVEDVQCIRFNRNFYCIDNHDSEIGCKGVLFFGASQVPIVNLDESNRKKMEILWTVFKAELESKDQLQLEMLQMLLKRFLILSTRIYKDENQMVNHEETKLDVIRNFSFLVEVHYKTKHTVAEYADLMNKPAKSLTNLFAIHIKKSPLQIIQDRIFLEARRILINSEKSIKETAYELGFEDIQSFSRFFKNKQGVSPKEFRENRNFSSAM